MSQDLAEQAANERTFLAWVRTGIAVVGFGFVVEKFNLFILAAAVNLSPDQAKAIRIKPLLGPIDRYDGLAFMLFGIAVIVLGYRRFAHRRLPIVKNMTARAEGVKAEMWITSILVALVAVYSVSIVIG